MTRNPLPTATATTIRFLTSLLHAIPCYTHRNSKPSTHPHLRCTAAARWRREVRSGGVAGEGVEGGPGGLLAGPDRPQPRRVLLRPRRVPRPVRGQRRRRGRAGGGREARAGAGDVPGL